MTRYIIYGAGGIGGVMGGRLHQGGHDVLLIARGAHHDAIRDNGLRVQSADDDVTLQIPVVDHPSKIAWQDGDILFLCMKSQDTQGALNDLWHVAPRDLPIVCAQNGVANEGVVLRSFPKVYGMCVMCPTNFVTPGIVQAYSAPTTGIMDLGCYPGGFDDVALEVAEALTKSTYVSKARPDIMRWQYGKLLMNLGNGLDALCGNAARGTGLFGRIREEGVEVLKAAGIDFVDSDEDAARRGSFMVIRPIDGEIRGGGSTWQSLHRGLATVETDYMNGEIVYLARKHGVQAPVNELMQQLMHEAVRDKVPAGSVDPVDIEARLIV